MSTALEDLQNDQFKLRYSPALDGLRGLSVLAVLAFHAQFFGRGGFLGVDIFFVLSGFLITTLLMQEKAETGSIDFRSFYLRRALRLFPALFAVLITLCISVIIRPPQDGTWSGIKSILPALYLSDYLPVHDALGHTWSLSIEEQFYVIWPLLLFAFLYFRIRRSRIFGSLLFLVLIVAVNRYVLWHTMHLESVEFPGRVYAALDTRADTLLIGCFTGLLLYYGLIPTRSLGLATLKVVTILTVAVFACLILILRVNSPFLYEGGFTVLACMVGVTIIGTFVAPITAMMSILEHRWLVWLGRISYGLYLWHVPVYRVVSPMLLSVPIKSYTLRLTFVFLVKLLASIAVAAISFYALEQPCLRLKNRLHSKKNRLENDRSVYEAAAG